MVICAPLQNPEHLAYFYWLQSLYLEEQLTLVPKVFQLLDPLNHLSFASQALPQMNSLFVWHLSPPKFHPNLEKELTRLSTAPY